MSWPVFTVDDVEDDRTLTTELSDVCSNTALNKRWKGKTKKIRAKTTRSYPKQIKFI